MAEPRLIVQHRLLPQGLVERFPSLIHEGARRQEMIESVYHELADDPSAFAVPTETAREVLDFYNRVVEDGRLLTMLRSDPKAVAGILGVDLSDEAAYAITETTGTIIGVESEQVVDVGITVVTVAVVGVTVTVIILGSAEDVGEEIIIDTSGRVRL